MKLIDKELFERQDGKVGRNQSLGRCKANACLLLYGKDLSEVCPDQDVDVYFGLDIGDPVQKDVFHIIQQYEKVMSLKHPLWSRFVGLLSDAIYMKSSEDLDGIEIGDFKNLIDNSKIRRTIPKPSLVYSRVQRVINLFRLIDPTFVNQKVLLEHRKSGLGFYVINAINA